MVTQVSNLFLSTISPDVRASLLRAATTVLLPVHTVLYEQATASRYAYFLLCGLASVVIGMPNGESAEVAFIGRQGLVGVPYLLGPALSSTRCMMQLSGSALRVPFSHLQYVFDNSSEVRGRVLDFVQEQAAVVAQIPGCNRLHNAEQRLTRWLLMAQDRTGYESLDFTQEYLSQMIATRRSTATLIAGALQERGLIRYSRGRIHILNRPGLETAACACYPIVKGLFDALYQGDKPLRPDIVRGSGPGPLPLPVSA
ncbi:MAG TPA: Crp/Fnr family transcriptional regulator [Acidobacteriaceae bacterium]|jgi:CRP-like cAMP-binding protein|nr:Crp/Fnr family transcriptional regulator [Acidobacteriaceae bacterium]